MKTLKTIVYLITMFLALNSCSKEDTNTDENSSNTQVNTITTWAHNFQPSTLSCNIGDTVYFDLGGSHNAIEVSEESYNNNDPTPIENGFEFGYGKEGRWFGIVCIKFGCKMVFESSLIIVVNTCW